jgi:hypothetical protein
METEGVVKFINPERAMAAVELEDGDITVFEMLDVTCKLELGDFISGDLKSQGRKTLFNLVKEERMDVLIKGIRCTSQSAIDLIR